MFKMHVRCAVWLVVAVLGGVGPACGSGLWFQIPAQPIWLSFDASWTVRADSKNPLLLGRNRQGLRFEVGLAGESDPKKAVAHRKASVETEFATVPGTEGRVAPAFSWGGHGAWQSAELRLRSGARRVGVAAWAVGGRTLVATVFGSKDRIDGLMKTVGASVKGAKLQPLRPGGVWSKIPSTHQLVRLPDEGWNTAAVGTGAVLHVRSESGDAELRISLEGRKDLDLDALLRLYSAGLGAGVVQWSKVQAWTPKKGGRGGVKGRRISGRGSMPGGASDQQVFMAVVVYPAPEGVVLMVATARGAGGAAQLRAMDAVCSSVKAL